MTSFNPLFDQAASVYKSVDADKSKVVFSQLANLLVGILVNRVIIFFKVNDKFKQPLT
jgi:hypothetical protein